MVKSEPKAAANKHHSSENENSFFSHEDAVQTSELSKERTPFFNGDAVVQKKENSSFFGGSFVQKKLKVGQPGDKYEQEADQMAEKIVQQKSESESVQLKEQSNIAIAPAISTIQKQSNTEEPEIQENEVESESELQKKPIFESGEPPEDSNSIQKYIQRSGNGGTASQGLESKLNSTKGQGSQLPKETQESMGSAFGSDFSAVRVHTNSDAVQMNKNLNSQAFTHGNDIYFNENKYNPSSKQGQHLLAHELTHTVQQGGAVQKKIQRVGGNNTGNTQARPTKFEGNKGTIDKTAKTVELKSLKVPPKVRNGSGVRKYQKDRNTSQATKWDAEIQKIRASLAGHVKTKANSQTGNATDPDGNKFFAFRLKGYGKNSQKGLVIGSAEEIATRAGRPYWSEAGKNNLFHVDHKWEYQIGGNDDLSNYWLFDSSANMSSGALTRNNLISSLQALIDEASGTDVNKHIWTNQRKPSPATIKQNYNEITFGRFLYNLSHKQGDSYEFSDIQSGKSITNPLVPLKGKELENLKLGDSDKLKLFSNKTGGSLKILDYDPVKKQVNMNGAWNVGSNADIKSVTWDGNAGSVNLELFKKTKGVKTVTTSVDILPLGGIPNAAYISSASVKDKLKPLGVHYIPFSLITPESAELVPGVGLELKGRLTPSISAIEKANIYIIISGNEVRFEKTFSGEDFNLPKPFKADECSLTASVGTNGIQVSGKVKVVVDKVGEGEISGSYSGNTFKLDGKFNAYSEFFDKSEVNFSYTRAGEGAGSYSIGGLLEIGDGKIPGVSKVSGEVKYADGVLTGGAKGTLKIPGFEGTEVEFASTNDSYTFGATIPLDKLPVVKSGTATVNVEKSKETGAVEVSGSGNATLNTPGIDTSLSVDIKGKKVSASANVAYQKGMLSGSITVGATNEPLDAEGQPTGGEPTATFSVYGSGQLTLKVAPWLQVGVGVKFKPDGNIEIEGEIGIPDAIEVFRRYEISRNIFTFPTVEIPIFAIPLGPRSLGIVATIGGGLDFSAGVGPGTIEELKGTIHYEPADESKTSVSASCKFVIPMDAGLRIYGRAGIGLSIGVARVTGNIELGGSLGIDGKAEAGAQVNWTPSSGLKLDASAKVEAEPKFKFDVGLVLEASALFLSKEWRKDLAQVEYGSGLKFGVEFPVKYEEGKPFNVSFDDIKVTKPDIDLNSIIKGLGRQMI